MSYKDTDVFARVINGAVVEYPVFYLHIVNRGHSVSMYSPVTFDVKPQIDEFTSLAETVSVRSNGTVIVRYTPQAKPLSQVLLELHGYTGIPEIDAGKPRKLISEVTPAQLQQVSTLSTVVAQRELDAFAATRGYEGILSAASYANSTIAKFKTEGERAVHNRDVVWTAFYQYLEHVQEGLEEVPAYESEIRAIIPELTWEDAEGDAE